jgi:hypothetical protein
VRKAVPITSVVLLVVSIAGLGGLPVRPDLEVALTPPSGVAQPAFARNIGDTSADNQDARVPVGVARVPADGRRILNDS